MSEQDDVRAAAEAYAKKRWGDNPMWMDDVSLSAEDFLAGAAWAQGRVLDADVAKAACELLADYRDAYNQDGTEDRRNVVVSRHIVEALAAKLVERAGAGETPGREEA